MSFFFQFISLIGSLVSLNHWPNLLISMTEILNKLKIHTHTLKQFAQFFSKVPKLNFESFIKVSKNKYIFLLQHTFVSSSSPYSTVTSGYCHLTTSHHFTPSHCHHHWPKPLTTTIGQNHMPHAKWPHIPIYTLLLFIRKIF